MQQQYHSNIGRFTIFTNQWTSSEYASLYRRFRRNNQVKTIINNLRDTAVYIGVTLMISTILLGSVYLFLTQLAEYGW